MKKGSDWSGVGSVDELKRAIDEGRASERLSELRAVRATIDRLNDVSDENGNGLDYGKILFWVRKFVDGRIDELSSGAVPPRETDAEARIREVLHLQATLDDLPLADESLAALLAYTRGRLASLRAELEQENARDDG